MTVIDHARQRKTGNFGQIFLNFTLFNVVFGYMVKLV